MGGNEMSNPTKNEAAKSTVDFELSTAENNGASGNGLTSENTLVQSDHVGEKARACGIIVSPRRMMRYGGRSPYDYRRIAAAPSFSQARGVSFGTFGNFLPSGSNLIRTFAKNFANAIRKHGIVASIDFMGAPCGELSSSPFPIERYFLHLHGAARPVGRADGFDNLSIGAPAMTLHDAASVHAHAHTVGASSLRAFLSILSCGNIRLPARMSGRRLGGLLKQRRMTAAPCFSKARGVSFKVSTFPGVDAPSSVIRHPGRIAPSEFVMGAPGGELSSSPLPLLRSANLPGVAHLLAEVSGFSNPNRGNSAMNKHEAVNAPARALNLGLCKVLNLINCFTGKAGYVQPLGSYPATGPGMRLPSIWKVNPELLELARVEANRAAASMEVRHA